MIFGPSINIPEQFRRLHLGRFGHGLKCDADVHSASPEFCPEMMEFETDSCLSKTIIRLTIASLDSAQKNAHGAPDGEPTEISAAFIHVSIWIDCGITDRESTQGEARAKRA